MVDENHGKEPQDLVQSISNQRTKDVVKVENVKFHPLTQKGIHGNSGAHFSFKNVKAMDAHVKEVKAGGRSKKHRHTYEAVVYILDGQGHSVIAQDGGDTVRIEWRTGDLFAVPAMYWHQHMNSDPEKPLRYLAVTSAPVINSLNLRYEEIENDGGTAQSDT